ncbi:F-box domain-containing protein [Pseudozyma hubeiensis]|nr:F-box domain-containing protein [Pseudozyma hubeiensis]
MEPGWLDGRRSAAADTTFSAMEQLPHEILLDIFAHLDTAALARLSATSSRIRQVALQDVLWKPFVARAIHSLSPPVHGPSIHPLESALPLWHPDFGLQADVVHPPSWPTLGEYVLQDPADLSKTAEPDVELHQFQYAISFYQVYASFIRVAETLLGWWASDVPFYGMVIRIVLDMHFSDEVEHATASPDDGPRSTPSAPAPNPSAPADAIKSSPSIVCQRVYPTNRLQGLDNDRERWSEVTGFPMPANSAVIGQGTILRRSLTQIRTDLCEPGIRTENLWHFSWDDVRREGILPAKLVSPPPPTTSSSSPSPPPLETGISSQRDGRGAVRAHISSQSWLRSLDPQDAPVRPPRRAHAGMIVINDDDQDEDDADLLEDEVEEGWVVRRMARAPDLFNLGFDLEENDPAQDILRRLVAGPHRHAVDDAEHHVYPFSDAVSARIDEGAEDVDVRVSTETWQPYVHANERNAAFVQSPLIVTPRPPTIFPPPALLPAIRSPPWSRLGSVQIGASDIWETMSANRRWLIEGERLTIDSLITSPPPPYRPWPIQAHALENGPRFFPICNPRRSSALPKPAMSSTDSVVYQHQPLPPRLDPANVDFDWSAVEGLYSMTYGPHGIELLYIRARELTSLDFEPDERLPTWPAEPLLSDDDMYEQTRINRRSAARVGARVLEAVKVLGDPNIPRGQITWRAFIDDPGRSGVAWRPPPAGFRKHTPWPLRPPQAISSQDERSPGLVLPAHGRVAGEGFVGPGWATALACISSIDEIQIWWQPMYKISIAKKLIGV